MRKVKISILALACSLLACTASTSCSSSDEDNNIPESPANPTAPGNTDGSNGSNGSDGSNSSDGSNTGGSNTGGSSNTGNPSGINYSSLITKTQAYPANYAEEAEHRGRVERIDYNTRDYAEGTNRSRSNTAYVYLPYGYDENSSQRYNIIYLVHGHYGTASTTFEAENGLQRKVLDHMMENVDCAPTIVVSPSYNYGQPTANYVDADPYCKALPLELVNDLIPLVETRYRTYLTSPDIAGIEASRDHRAIGGFSMGGVTTWYALDETLNAFRYFLPMSGDCWSLGSFAGMNRPTQTTDYLANIVRKSPYQNAFYIWAASGTSDSAYSEILIQVRAMAQEKDVFGLDRMTFHEKDGARHEFRPSVEYVYNALPFFFPTDRGESTGIQHTKYNTKNIRQ